MPSKNDLSSLKVSSKNSLIQAQKNSSSKSLATAGRKPKPLQEKQSELIGLRFTVSEIRRIKEKAGLIPIATYIKDALYKNTDILLIQ